MSRRLINLVGEQFGKLKVISRVENTPRSDGKTIPSWLCLCDCGNYRIVLGASLRSGNTKSCGCINRKHGASCANGKNKPSRLYRIWIDIKGRCYYPSTNSYSVYGGRGIKMCDEWRKSFTAFEQWAISNGYSDELSIDRINNDGDYEPSNCRWATSSEQRLNQRAERKRNLLGQYTKDVINNERN